MGEKKPLPTVTSLLNPDTIFLPSSFYKKPQMFLLRGFLFSVWLFFLFTLVDLNVFISWPQWSAML